MAVERRDPLPAGRYWIWLLPSESARWQSWIRESGGAVRVRLTEDSGDGAHVVFDVLSPVRWVGFGYPSIVEPGTLPGTQQTVQAPGPEPGFADRLDSAIGRFQTVLVVGAGIWLFSKVLSGRSRHS